MRDFLDAILEFIVAESLTDEEYATVLAPLPIYDQTTYDDLARILAERESVSDMQDRLIAYYRAKSVEVVPYSTANSQIFMGRVLE